MSLMYRRYQRDRIGCAINGFSKMRRSGFAKLFRRRDRLFNRERHDRPRTLCPKVLIDSAIEPARELLQ